MNTKTGLLAAATMALVIGTGGAFAQQQPARSATGAQHDSMAPRETNNNKDSNASLTFDTTPNDKERLRKIFGKDRSARRIEHVNFSLAVGTVVPGSVRLVSLPQTIIDIQPTWQGNDYFRVGHQIMIVDHKSKQIVGVLSI